MKSSLGVYGCGFIGSAVGQTFNHYVDVKTYDIKPELCTHTFPEVLAQEVLIMALPTPMNKDGSVDTSIVEEAIKKISDNLPAGVIKPVVLKSTIPPSKLGKLMLDYPSVFLVHSPEFLTERSAVYDFQQSNRFIFGTLIGEQGSSYAKLIKDLFELRFPKVPQYWVSFAESSLIKYFSNNYFMSKIALFNEYSQICKEWGLDYASVIGKVMLDPRIGRSHFQVPGHDGLLGAGGSCFIKDNNGYFEIAKDCGVDPKVMKGVWKKNLEVRGAFNLLDEINKMKGRISAEEFTFDELLKLGE